MLFPQIQILIFFLTVLSACERDAAFVKENSEISASLSYKATNVIIVVVDGPRFSETMGDSTYQYIPHLKSDLLPQGVVFTNFYNGGPTYTNAGYTAICTGNYQEIDNAGNELPDNPSVLQYFMKAKKTVQNAAWLITSKGKLKILAGCADSEWNGKHIPSFNCGVDGNGSGYREDSVTLSVAIETLKREHPALAVIGFKEPDITAHSGDWEGYLQEITKTDEYVFQLWNFIQSDSVYKDKTAFFVTNDHGRHTGDFTGHGDSCEGCRHINLFAAGPDFYANKTINTFYEQVDVSATAAAILYLDFPTGKGKVMKEVFKP